MANARATRRQPARANRPNRRNRPNGCATFVKEHSSAVPTAILRFIIFVPYGVYEALARKHWKVIRENGYLQGPPFNPLVTRGERLAAQWGGFGFYWNFAVWVPSMILPPPLSLPFAIVDALLAVQMSLVTSMQTSYAPHDVDRCKGSPGTHNWQRPAGANESFFDAAARLNATTTDSFRMCKAFTQEWQYGVAISVFYCLIAALNLFMCVGSCAIGYLEARRQRKNYWLDMFKVIASLPKIIAAVIIAWVYWLPVCLFRCLPIAIKSRTRYARNYVVKTGLKVEQDTEMAIKHVRRKDAVMTYKGDGTGHPTNLAEFLDIYDILMLVVPYLHYADIQNLSLASKSVREAVLPAADYQRRQSHFRLYTCASGKKQCWVCNNQICHKCRVPRSLKQTQLYYHLDHCRPYCSACYFKDVQNKPQPKRIDAPTCRCAPPTDKPNLLQRYIKGSAYYRNYTAYRSVTRHVCRECHCLTDGELLSKRGARTKHDLKDPNRAGMDTCRGCQGHLGRGPRWWVCKGCKKSCGSFVHAAWGNKTEGGTVVGEDNV